MKKNHYSKKIMATGIIVLFVGLVFTQSIIAQINQVSSSTSHESNGSELVEITAEVCGMEGAKPYTVKLTKQRVSELEHLFDTIKIRLDAAKTDKETVAIFNKAVVSLNEYGLLPKELNIEQAQKLVTGEYQDLKISKLLEKTYNRNLKFVTGNFLCSIVGNTSNCHFLKIFNINLCFFISFGNWERCGYGYVKVPSEGWVWTQGLNGIINWTDEFYGYLHPYIFFGLNAWSFLGASGFRGITINYDNGYTYFLGSALRAKLNPEKT